MSDEEDTLDNFVKITGCVRHSLKTDDNETHKYQGIRSAQQVYQDRKGHCIELTLFLIAILSKYNIPTRLVFVKNPKGFDVSMEGWGVHPNLITKYEGEVWHMDTVSGLVGIKRDL